MTYMADMGLWVKAIKTAGIAAIIGPILGIKVKIAANKPRVKAIGMLNNQRPNEVKIPTIIIENILTINHPWRISAIESIMFRPFFACLTELKQ